MPEAMSWNSGPSPTDISDAWPNLMRLVWVIVQSWMSCLESPAGCTMGRVMSLSMGSAVRGSRIRDRTSGIRSPRRQRQSEMPFGIANSSMYWTFGSPGAEVTMSSRNGTAGGPMRSREFKVVGTICPPFFETRNRPLMRALTASGDLARSFPRARAAMRFTWM